MAYKQSPFPMAYGSRSHSMAKQKATMTQSKGKIIYKDGKKYYQASDGSLHTGQVEDYERELAADKANAPKMGPPEPPKMEKKKSPNKQRKQPVGPQNRLQPENPKEINKVDPVTGGNNAEYEKEAGKLMQMYKDGKITKEELDKKKKALIARLRK